MWAHLVYFSLCLLLTVVNGVRLIRENGFRDNTHYYHLGDGGFAYHFSDESLSSIYFKCVLYESGCRGRAILRLGGGFRHTQNHNHPPDPDYVGERHFRENVLNQVRDGAFVSYQEIMEQARADRRYTRRVRSRMTLRKLRSSMYRVRMSKYPKIPYTLRELTQVLLQNPQVSETIDGSQNLYAGSITATDGSHHVGFVSQRILEFMEHVTIIQGDGTFRARPALPVSAQCFVIVTVWRNCVIPLAWFLMESKTYEAYQSVFHLLKTLCPNLDPDVIISDWEWPQQRAWEKAFPNATIQGCLWHLCRAFVKKVKKLGLMKYRKTFPDLLSYVRKACAISLLPENFLEVGLEVLKHHTLEENIVVAYLLDPFFNYVQNRWLGNDCRREWMCLFNCLFRTNNACETHNRMLRKKVGAYRPNIYVFIQALATLEHNASLDIDLLRVGGSPKRTRSSKSVYTDRQLKALCTDLEMDIFHDRDTTILNFLSRASHLFHGSFDDHVLREAGEA